MLVVATASGSRLRRSGARSGVDSGRVRQEGNIQPAKFTRASSSSSSSSPLSFSSPIPSRTGGLIILANEIGSGWSWKGARDAFEEGPGYGPFLCSISHQAVLFSGYTSALLSRSMRDYDGISHREVSGVGRMITFPCTAHGFADSLGFPATCYNAFAKLCWCLGVVFLLRAASVSLHVPSKPTGCRWP